MIILIINNKSREDNAKLRKTKKETILPFTLPAINGVFRCSAGEYILHLLKSLN